MRTEECYLPRTIRLLVIHCSATKPETDYTVERLRADHLARGFHGIGYHFYIRRSGELIHTRPLSEVGAHASGFNCHSIGICYEGGIRADGQPADTRTPAQMEALTDLLTLLKKMFPAAEIKGHYQLSAHIHKACPCFDAAWEYRHL